MFVDIVAILGMVGSVLAALFAYFAWSATREREPFRLSPKADDVFVITRTGLRKAHMDNLWVRHHRCLSSTDDRADIGGRVLKNREFITVLADDIPTGEELTVIWRRWPLRKKQRFWRAPILATSRQ